MTAELDWLLSKCKANVWIPNSTDQTQVKQVVSVPRECASTRSIRGLGWQMVDCASTSHCTSLLHLARLQEGSLHCLSSRHASPTHSPEVFSQRSGVELLDGSSGLAEKTLKMASTLLRRLESFPLKVQGQSNLRRRSCVLTNQATCQCVHCSVSGTIVMDEMNILPGKGTGDDAQALMRDPVGWRAAVFGRLGNAVTEATWIERHQPWETALLEKQLRHLCCKAKALAFIQSASTDATRRGTAVCEGGAPSPQGEPATLSPRPKLLPCRLWTRWTEGIDGCLPAKNFTTQQQGNDEIKRMFCLSNPLSCVSSG